MPRGPCGCLLSESEPIATPIVIEPGEAVMFLHEHCSRTAYEAFRSASRLLKVPAGAVFEPEEVLVLCQAMDEACSFLLGCGALRPAKRRQVALAIIKYALGGVRDPHRLAIKGIVGVG